MVHKHAQAFGVIFHDFPLRGPLGPRHIPLWRSKECKAFRVVPISSSAGSSREPWPKSHGFKILGHSNPAKFLYWNMGADLQVWKLFDFRIFLAGHVVLAHVWSFSHLLCVDVLSFLGKHLLCLVIEFVEFSRDLWKFFPGEWNTCDLHCCGIRAEERFAIDGEEIPFEPIQLWPTFGGHVLGVHKIV